MLGQIKKMKDQVINLLEQFPECRDNDHRLYMVLLYNIDQELKGCVFEQFAKKFVEGSYPSFESITRARRKAQEENVNLRGKNYMSRQLNAADVRDGINK